MSWQNRYLLPWDRLDPDRIEAAVRYVMASGRGLTLRRYEIEPSGPDRTAVFFYFDAGLERKWSALSVDRVFELYGIRDDEEGNVEIDFAHTPADPALNLPAETYFEFYSNVSGNPLYSGVGVEIGERIGRFLGTTCEPL